MALFFLLLLPFTAFAAQLQYNGADINGGGDEGMTSLSITVNGNEVGDSNGFTLEVKQQMTQQNSDKSVLSMGSNAIWSVDAVLTVPAGYESMTVYEIYIEVQPKGCAGELLMDETITLDGAALTTGRALTGNSDTGIITISADIGNNGIELSGSGDYDLTFYGDFSNGCEPDEFINYVYVDAVIVSPTPTGAPTENPTDFPTENPVDPPAASCAYPVTWGDPHTTKSFNGGFGEMHEQVLGDIYYMFPCDYTTVDTFPYHLVATHTRCWWGGHPYGCINSMTVYITTVGTSWEIQVGSWIPGNVIVTVGTDEDHVQSDFNSISLPLSFDYDDGEGNMGEVEVYRTHDWKLAFTLNVQGHNMVNEQDETYVEVCDDLIDVQFHLDQTWMMLYCPECYRNLVCGMLGWYTGTDCSHPNNKIKCDQEFRLWNNTYLDSPGADKFQTFAMAWHKDTVDTLIAATSLKSHDLGVNPKLQPIFLKEDDRTLSKEGRAIDMDGITVVGKDDSYPGYCNGTDVDADDAIAEVDQICDDAISKWDTCCDQIGICDEFFAGCTYDMCACLVGQTEAACLAQLVDITLNKTCSEDVLYPTDAPSSSPTEKPTTEPLTEAEALVWYAVAFVVVFLIAAGAAYWYYRKKSGKSFSTESEQEEQAQMTTQNQTEQAITTSVYA